LDLVANRSPNASSIWRIGQNMGKGSAIGQT
jgi:hypothetical protein